MRKSLASTIKKALACLMACLAAASLCACGKGVKPAPAETPAPSLSPEATAEPEQGGTLRMPIPVNAPRSDPMNVNTKEMLYLFSLIYEPLLNVGPAGELEPCLCESWVSEENGLWLLRYWFITRRTMKKSIALLSHRSLILSSSYSRIAR